MAHEVPPTAGLPLRAADLFAGSDADLGAALAQFLGVAAVQVECSGTAALVVALTALKARSAGRLDVVVPAYTCPLVALAVAHCGLQLRLCDLQPDSLDMDPVALRALCGPNTLAVMPTHLGGRVTDVAPAREAARAVGAWVIEDAAQALGAQVDGKCIGVGSDIVFFSMAVGKGLTLFEGGALVVADAALRAECARASAAVIKQSPVWELRRSVELLGYAALYRPALLRLAYGNPLRKALAQGDRIAAAGDDFSSSIPLHRVGRWRQAVGVRALARLAPWLRDGQTRGQARAARLSRIPSLTVLQDSAATRDAQGTWPAIWVLLPDAKRRDAALAKLWGAGVGVSVPFVHALPDYAQYADVVPAAAPGELPNARSFASRLLSISNSPWLDDERFEGVCETLAQPAS